MALTLTDIDFLQSATGQDLLIHLADADLSPTALLPLITQLRQSHPQDHVRAAVTMAQLRQQAVAKFGDDAGKLFFTDAALQQASDLTIRRYRAAQVEGARVLDAGCGIGSDSIAFARHHAQVHGIDRDETRIAIARYNAHILDLEIDFTVGDLTKWHHLASVDLIFFDPARRTAEGKRIYDVEQYQPPLRTIEAWQGKRLMVKLSPGVDLTQLEPYGGTVEFISVDGNLKEAVLHHPATVPTIATLIADGIVHHWENAGEEYTIPISEPAGWLCEPDASLLRANLVQAVAAGHEGTMLDPMIAYFCTSYAPESPWVRSWKIREWLPFNLKKLRARLRTMDVGTLTVKKRGSPIEPQELIRKLKLKGSQSATVVLTRLRDAPIAIICDDILAV